MAFGLIVLNNLTIFQQAGCLDRFMSEGPEEEAPTSSVSAAKVNI